MHQYAWHESGVFFLRCCNSWKEVKFAAAAPNNSQPPLCTWEELQVVDEVAVPSIPTGEDNAQLAGVSSARCHHHHRAMCSEQGKEGWRGAGRWWRACQDILIWCQPNTFWHAIRLPSDANTVVYKKRCLRSLSLSQCCSYNPVPNYRKVGIQHFTSWKIVQA